MRMSLLAVIATAGAAAVAAGPAALAADYTPGAPVLASPALSPLPDPCPFQGETETQENFKNTEVEPLVAVNPTNPDNVIGVFQETSPTPLTGASTTGSVWNFEFALAIATASSAARAIESLVSWEVAAKPQVPCATTRTPKPLLVSSLTETMRFSRARKACVR